MKVGIMQPYFFPYLGYFSLINSVDRFFLLEDVQFIHHGWINRNRILNYNSDWNYIKVPLVKYSRDTLIKDIKINNSEIWKEKLLSQLVHYKRKAKFYYKTIKLIEDSLEYETNSVTKLNRHILSTICDYLDIKTTIEIFDIQKIAIKKPEFPDEWALNICMALGNVDTYINPEGGQAFFDISKYAQEGINAKFIKCTLRNYEQHRENFISGLSIIDVLMFNSKDEIKKMLGEYTIV